MEAQQRKKNLREDIINAVVKPEMTAEFIYKMKPEYQFNSNLKNLRVAIEKQHDTRMKDDCKYYVEDRKLLKEIRKNDPPRVLWHQSEAHNLLKVAVNEKKHTRTLTLMISMCSPMLLRYSHFRAMRGQSRAGKSITNWNT